MNITSSRICRITAAAALTLLGTVPATLWAGKAPGFVGPYLTLDVGANFADDLAVQGYGSITPNTGFRTGVSGGYAFRINDVLSFATEGELGVLYNTLSRINDGAGGTVPISGQFTQVPILANGVFNWAMGPRWVGYAGAGIGIDRLVLSDMDFYTLASETDFAWQVKAGVRVRLGSGYVGLGYQYLAVAPEGLRKIGNSAVLASYTFKFH